MRGEARCVVVNTGANTYFGRTAELVKVAKPKSHQEEIMMAITKYMMYFGLAALILTSAYALLLNMGILSILTFAVVFLMSAIPVALPAVLTIVQAVGAMELAKEGVLVTRLDSIEDAASIDIVCLDKTGTITQNKLSVVEVIPFSGYKKEDVALMAALASEGDGKDVIDLTVISYAKSLGVDLDSYKRVSFTPFNPSIKRSEAIVEGGGVCFKAVKGAPQVIISLCRKADTACQEADKMLDKLSEKGYRTLAVAKSGKEGFDDLQLVGLLALADPIRPDSKAMIEAFHLEGEGLQTFTMLTLVFYSQFRVYIVRERRHFWSSKPGRELIISIIATLIGFTLLGIYGIIIPPLPPYQVLLTLGFSALFTIGIIDPFKYRVFKKLQL
jgi:H+-transporting ATPase